jgi:hypothetical protein
MSNLRIPAQTAAAAAFLIIAGCSDSSTSSGSASSGPGSPAQTAEVTLYLAGMNHRLKIL